MAGWHGNQTVVLWAVANGTPTILRTLPFFNHLSKILSNSKHSVEITKEIEGELGLI
jgi:hypothetical protein